MYRGLTIGETYIKIYEAGLTNIPTNLTTINVVPKDINKTKEVRNPESEKKNHIVKILMATLLLTATSFSSSIISIYLFNS